MKIEDHIATYDNLLTANECQEIIEYFESLSSLNLTYSRYETNDAPSHKKDDIASFVLSETVFKLKPDNGIMHVFLNKFWSVYDMYLKHYSVLGETGPHQIRSMKIQKTLPGQGYHVWHFESDGSKSSDRICAWGLYLNTISEGGETEFLYQKKRITAVEGRLVLWPAGYTHVHRGNPPLSGKKYLLTGWVEWQ